MAAKDKFSQINRETPINAKKALEMVGELQKNGAQVKDVGGVFAVTLMNRFGINPKKEKTLDGLKAKLIAHGNNSVSKVQSKDKNEVNPEKVQSKIDKKTENISKSVTKKLKGDEKLEELVKVEVKKNIIGKEVTTIEDSSKNLQQKMAEMEGVDVNSKHGVAAKEAVIGAKKIELEHIDEVRELKRKKLIEEIKREYEEKNPQITDKQLELVDVGANLVADTYYTGKGVENSRDEVLANAPKKGVVPLSQAWTDVEGTVKLLQKSPGEIKEIQSKYQLVKDGLSSLNQPTNIKELTSFNSLMGALKNEGVMANFNLGQSKFLSWVDRFDTFSGGAIRRTVANWGGKFISKIGTESTKVFLENGLKVFAEKGFQAGFNATLQGFLGGGATAAAGTAGAGAMAGAGATAGATAAGGAAAAGATVATGGIAALVIAAGVVLKGIKDLGKKIKERFSDYLTGSGGKDEDLDKLTKRTELLFALGSILLLTGCMTHGNDASSVVSPKKDVESAEYGGEYGVSILQEGSNDFKIPTCDPDGKNPNGNNRLILREIALSVVGKITYSGFNVWHQQGASPKWNTPVPQKWITVTGPNGKPTQILDPVHEKKRKMYPLYGLDCGGIAKWLWYQCMIDSWNKPNIGDWFHVAKNENSFGLDEVHLESVDDLKIGDIFERRREESIPACQEIDKKTGKVIKEAGCHHFAIYIGNGDVIEEVGNGGDPALTKIYAVTPEYVLLERDHNAFRYPHTYRITDVFKD